MDIISATDWARRKLSMLENPRLEAEVLLSEVLQVDRIFLKTYSEREVAGDQWSLFEDFVLQRSQHIPVAFILGYKWWSGLKIGVTPNVLIPRDETEVLVHNIMEHLRGRESPSILDIGTGSGCIALYLKKNIPTASVTALDISEDALEVARKNAVNQRLDIDFIQSDLLSELPLGASFDIVVANLPYVPDSPDLAPEIYQEPGAAIFSGTDGLDHIRRLRDEIKDKKIEFQQLWLEFLPTQKEAIESIFTDHKCDFIKDVSGGVFFVKITKYKV